MSLFGSLFGTTQKGVEIATPLELVTYAAGLVSNQDAVGPMLDIVRSVTAHILPGQDITPDGQRQLLGAYIQLEEYLTTKEPLRSFTKEELRRRISQPLTSLLNDYEATAKA